MRSSILYPSVLLVCLLCSVFFYQNCSQYKSNFHTNSGSDGVVAEDEDPTSFKIPTPPYGTATQIDTGDFITLAAGKTLNMNISGKATLIRTGDGKTRVDVAALGLPVGSLVAAHVHILPCAQGAGTHYKKDSSISGTVRSNEIWPMIFTDATGYGYGSIETDHVAGASAVSVVIHGGPEAAKVACADLKPQQVTPNVESGTFAFVGTGASAITGRAILVRKANGQSEVRTAISGLTAATAYASHLHDLDCASAGLHYKIDQTISTAVETNEIWPLLMTNAAGQGIGIKTVDHTVRTTPTSVVVHDPVGGAKLACATLTSGGGAFMPTEVGLTRNRIVRGSGTIDRAVNGGTTFSVNVTGLAPNTSYMSHVHNRPCAMGGGLHYKVDESVTTAVALNEIWLTLNSDATGAAMASVTAPHIARPDAVAIVIHDPSDAAKLACVDLY